MITGFERDLKIEITQPSDNKTGIRLTMFQCKLSHSLLMPIKAIQVRILPPHIAQTVASVRDGKLVPMASMIERWQVSRATLDFFTVRIVDMWSDAPERRFSLGHAQRADVDLVLGVAA